ncbi:MAG: uracil-DNA glycosylase [Spirochaetota bacterium]
MSESQHEHKQQLWELLGKTEQLLKGKRLLVPSQETPDFSSPGGDEAAVGITRMNLEQLSETIRECHACRLHAGRTQAVPGKGVVRPKVMIIGEAPGAQEDARGEPFVGRSGTYLDKWLQAIGLTRESDTFIGNIIKCRPPENRDPFSDEQEACLPYLRRQIELINPETILCLGRVAAQILLDSNEGIGKLRGRVFSYQQVPLLVTYHPAAVLRSPDRFRRPVWEDLQQLQKLFSSTRDQE